MNVRDKEYFKQRAAREMQEELPVIDAPVPELLREAGKFLMQPQIVKGTFAYWARRAG